MIGSAPMVLRLGGALVAGVAVAAAAGCTSSGSPSTTPASATTSSPPASAVSTPSSPAASAPASSPASAPSSPATSVSASAPASGGGGGGAADGCATRDLQAKVGTAEGAAGSTYQVIDFTNIGTAPCTLYGYPGVSLAAGTPVTQVGMAASRSAANGGPSTVTLAPGATANALLRITQAQNYPPSTCAPKDTTYLQIYPPNQTTPIYLSYTSTGCTSSAVNLLTVGVVQAGAGSGQ